MRVRAQQRHVGAVRRAILDFEESPLLVTAGVLHQVRNSRVESAVRRAVAPAGQNAPGSHLFAVQQARVQRCVRAGLHFDLPLALLRGPAGIEVHHGGEALAVLDAQPAGQDFHAVDQLGREEPAEQSAHRVGERNAVELVLDVGVVPAGEEVPERVVDEARLRGEDLVDRLGAAARQLLDLFAVERGHGGGDPRGCRRQGSPTLDHDLLLRRRPQRNRRHDYVAGGNSHLLLGHQPGRAGCPYAVASEGHLLELEMARGVGHVFVDGTTVAREELNLRAGHGTVAVPEDGSFDDSQVRAENRERHCQDQSKCHSIGAHGSSAT